VPHSLPRDNANHIGVTPRQHDGSGL
jgi:hypothetical protein